MKIISGIYSIKNTITGQSYIGQSINIYNRWVRHRYQLNSNLHNNSYLQKSWNKYGSNNFEFTILVKCKKQNLKKYEKIEVNKITPNKRYNISKNYDNLYGKNNPFYGKTHNKKNKTKFSLLAKQRTGKKNGNFGNVYSYDTRIKAGHNKKTKLTIEQVKTIIKITNKTHQEIANIYGVSRTAITRVKNGKRWGLITKLNKEV